MNIKLYPTSIKIVFHLQCIKLFLILDYSSLIIHQPYYYAADVHYLIIYLILVPKKIYLIPISIPIVSYFPIDISLIIILNSISFHSILPLNNLI